MKTADNSNHRNTSQLSRFKEAARKAGADDSDDALDRAFAKLDVKHKPDGGKDKKGSEDGGSE